MLIDTLQAPSLYDHPVESFRIIETHISWVLLTGPYAYKIKKPVNLGFVDFTTLDKRAFYCREELRLNRRLAGDLYRDVVAFTGSAQAPVLNGAGEVFEYAVRMREFDQSALWSRLARSGAIQSVHVDSLADTVARFHQSVPVAAQGAAFGTNESVEAWSNQNLEELQASAFGATHRAALDELQAWLRESSTRLHARFAERKRDGFVRECHGDMHLGNIALIDGEVTVFDCIEFNEELRWIDVMSDVAFVVMDLYKRTTAQLARRMLDRYLMNTGDYHGLDVLPYYLVYRALVRAKVSALSAAGDANRVRRKRESYEAYVDCAQIFRTRREPKLFLTHGLSGSGKSTVAHEIVERIGAIRLRSDVERKRLFGLGATAQTGSALLGGIYTPEATERTYARLQVLAEQVVNAGFNPVIDAACLKRSQRDEFRQLARKLGAELVILDIRAPTEVLRARILARRESRDSEPSEADEAVLEAQLRSGDPLADDELPRCVIDTSSETWRDALAVL